MADPELTPEESLRLIAQGRAAVAVRQRGAMLLYYLPWGLTWFIAFGLFTLDQGPGSDGPWIDLPDTLPLIVLFTLMAVSIAITIGAGLREATRVGGESNRRGAMYGISWMLAFGTIFPILGRFAEYLPDDHRGLLFGSVSIALTGVFFLVGGAIWLDWSMLTLGGWLLLVNLAGVLAGPGWHSLLVSVAGGGAMIVTALVVSAPARRSPS